MSYLDYINYFWRKDREYFFSPDEVAIYFRLLNHANEIGWKPQFNLSLERLMLEVGIKSRKSFDTARKTLREAGLLEFENGNGRGCATRYTLTAPEATPKRGAKNTPLSGTLSEEVSGKNRAGFGQENGAVHKSKIKIKNKGANAPGEGAKKSAKKPAATPSPPPPEPESWLAWVLANAPRVQQMKSPLTAGQWDKLRADFGETMLHDVLGHMENHADLLKKYTSANLTAREWCRRRCPDGKPPRPAPAAPASSAPDEPELNHAEIARRDAQREAELSAQRRQRRAQATA